MKRMIEKEGKGQQGNDIKNVDKVEDDNENIVIGKIDL